MFTRFDIATAILSKYNLHPKNIYEVFTPMNLALSKYWGKRNVELNLPFNSSLSITLPCLGTKTIVKRLDNGNRDIININGEYLLPEDNTYQRLVRHIDLFRCAQANFFEVESCNNMASSAGLASSASGFAALTKAIVGLLGIDMEHRMLSILARLGSGSACRSMELGFNKWFKGKDSNGMDSYAVPVPVHWPNFRVGVQTLVATPKPLSSSHAMAHTAESSPFFDSWIKIAEDDLNNIERAIYDMDIHKLGSIAEQNALGMHACMLASRPSFCYWTSETISVMHKVWELRKEAVSVYFSIDAGPNVKLIFEKEFEERLVAEFPEMQVVSPFFSHL